METSRIGKFWVLRPSFDKSENIGNPLKDHTPPSAPKDLKMIVQGSDQIYLYWNHNKESDLAYYNIYRFNSIRGIYKRVASRVTCNNYFDSKLEPETTYYYIIRAVDTSRNESSNSNITWGKTDIWVEGSTPFQRPAYIGTSIGHVNITAGTIGCVVKDAQGNTYILSNNHVFADENNAYIGDDILQPGPYDGGKDPRDMIGQLYDFEPIIFSWTAWNVIDAAIAMTSADLVTNSTPPGSYGIPSSKTATAYIGMPVQKHGRTTGQTYGEVVGINAIVYIRYDSGVAQFLNQIIITPGSFAYGGDSGSLIVTQQGNHPVALLYAGSSQYIIANPIDDVLNRFNITFNHFFLQ